MKITNTTIRKTFTEGNLKAIVSITIDDCLAVHDIKVIEGSGRTFVAMPSRKSEDDVYRDIVHPIGTETRNQFEREILTAYENYVMLSEIMNDKTVTV